jgi:hypothetical protein
VTEKSVAASLEQALKTYEKTRQRCARLHSEEERGIIGRILDRFAESIGLIRIWFVASLCGCC